MAQDRNGVGGRTAPCADRSARSNTALSHPRISRAITLNRLLPTFIPRIGIAVRHRPAKINRRRNSRTRASITGAFPKIIIELVVARQPRLHDQKRAVIICNAHGIVVTFVVRIHFVSNQPFGHINKQYQNRAHAEGCRPRSIRARRSHRFRHRGLTTI